MLKPVKLTEAEASFLANRRISTSYANLPDRWLFRAPNGKVYAKVSDSHALDGHTFRDAIFNLRSKIVPVSPVSKLMPVFEAIEKDQKEISA